LQTQIAEFAVSFQELFTLYPITIGFLPINNRSFNRYPNQSLLMFYYRRHWHRFFTLLKKKNTAGCSSDNNEMLTGSGTRPNNLDGTLG